MTKQDTKLVTAIKNNYKYSISTKAKRYVNAFYDKTKTTTQIKAKVAGNHGEYTVSIKVKGNSITSACSCYIGKHGGCHHCEALAFNFINAPASFKKKTVPRRKNISDLETLRKYLEGVTLEDLVAEMKKKGITQAAFAESIGMSSRHLGAIKSAEKRNRHFHELGATKLACLWVLEHF